MGLDEGEGEGEGDGVVRPNDILWFGAQER